MKLKDVNDNIYDTWLYLINTDLVDIRVYPAAINGIQRTEREDGWNDAVTHMVKQRCIFNNAITQDRLSWKPGLYLVVVGIACLSLNNDEIELLINCNDSFAYASADCEVAPKESWPLIAELYDMYGYSGVLAWISKQRDGLMPLKELQTQAFLNALNG